MHAKRLAISLICSFFCLPVLAADVLRFAASSSWNLPYGKFDGEQLNGGIVFDLAQLVGKTIDMPVVFVVLPRKRLDGAALSGDYDLRCYINPKWTDIPDKFIWSPKLLSLSDVVFGTASTPDPKTLSGLTKGALVSTVLGYGYNTLEPMFVAGDLVRNDSVGQENVMLKLSIARTPYGVSDALALDWFQRSTPQHRHSKWRLVISQNDFQCAIPKSGNVPPAKILQALDDLKRSGRIDEMLNNYR